MLIKKPKTRKFLYEDEVKLLIDQAQYTSHPVRNQALLLVTYIHAYRATEVCNLKWQNIDLTRRNIIVNRQKGGVVFTHNLCQKEIELLTELKATKTDDLPYVFITRRNEQFDRWTCRSILDRIQANVDLEVYVHFHMLRHAKLRQLRSDRVPMEDIRDYGGHRHMASTEIYTRWIDNRFDNINHGSIFT